MSGKNKNIHSKLDWGSNSDSTYPYLFPSPRKTKNPVRGNKIMALVVNKKYSLQ